MTGFEGPSEHPFTMRSPEPLRPYLAPGAQGCVQAGNCKIVDCPGHGSLPLECNSNRFGPQIRLNGDLETGTGRSLSMSWEAAAEKGAQFQREIPSMYQYPVYDITAEICTVLYDV